MHETRLALFFVAGAAVHLLTEQIGFANIDMLRQHSLPPIQNAVQSCFHLARMLLKLLLLQDVT